MSKLCNFDIFCDIVIKDRLLPELMRNITIIGNIFLNGWTWHITQDWYAYNPLVNFDILYS